MNLYQDKTWTVDGVERPIESLDAQHRRNLIAWLRRRAEGLELSDAISYMGSPLFPQGEIAADECVDALCDRDPIEWLESTPLFQRLVEIEAAS